MPACGLRYGTAGGNDGAEARSWDCTNSFVAIDEEPKWTACSTCSVSCPRDAYTDETFAARERKTVFTRNWVHVAGGYELPEPDLWAELQREAQQLGGTIFDDVIENTPFTVDEQNEVASQLQALAEHVRRTYSLSAAQMQALDGRLDYLTNAAGRIGRKDWVNVCAAAILGYVLTASLPPEAAHYMFLRLMRAIGHLFLASSLSGMG